MNHPFQIIPSDSFVKILNQNNISVVDAEDDYRAEQDWMFENECNFIEEQQLSQQPMVAERSQALFGGELLSKVKKIKEDDLLKKNKEVFQANQSKSIYLNKIQQLIDKPTILAKPKQTRQKVIVESDSSDGKNRLAKNRESARNSRKRKKIYIELLENKVKELTDQIKQLEFTLQQNKIKNLQLETFIDDYHQQIRQLNGLQSIQLIQEQYGSTSQRRWSVCTELINLLIDTTIPLEVKRLMESAKNGTDMFHQPLFQNNPCYQYRDFFKQGTIDLEIATKNFGVAYDKIREQVFNLERMKFEVIQIIGANQYIEFLNSR